MTSRPAAGQASVGVPAEASASRVGADEQGWQRLAWEPRAVVLPRRGQVCSTSAAVVQPEPRWASAVAAGPNGDTQPHRDDLGGKTSEATSSMAAQRQE